MVSRNGDMSIKAELNDDMLENVRGGAFAGGDSNSDYFYQISFQGSNLPMGIVVSSLAEMIPEIKGVFGSNYDSYKTYTLNQLCTTYGASTIQAYFDNYSRTGK